MGVTDYVPTDLASELLKMLWTVCQRCCFCKSSAEQLIEDINELRPIIHDIKYSGVELSASRQAHLDRLSDTLRQGIEICHKVLNSSRWNVYRNHQLSRQMEKIEKAVSRFLNGPLQFHILADVQLMRSETAERLDRIERSACLGSMKMGMGGSGVGGWWMEEALRRADEEERWENNSVNLGVGLGAGKKRLKELVMGREDLGVVGICGIGGSGKTTLAREFCRDAEVRSYFKDRILFLTVSQSPNVEQLRAQIWGYIMGPNTYSSYGVIPQWTLQHEWKTEVRTLVVLDDVWSLSDLEKLISRTPGCRTLVVSRSRFPTVLKATYDVEMLKEEEAISLFCQSAFGQASIPPTANQNLVKQIVSECKGLPLALKVIGASLREQNELFWASAKNMLSRGQAICESHESKLLGRMATSIKCLSDKVRECFLDLGAFPEDKKIPLGVVIDMWVEMHDIDEDEAFAILLELSQKNLLTLVKDSREGDIYSSFYDIFVTQHDVLRDLALHMSSRKTVNDRRRLLMPRREKEIPKNWLRTSDHPFNARLVSVHTDEMKEMDWTFMEFPKAEVLILNFSSEEYFLPPFISNMPNLRALVVVNYGASNATLENTSVLADLQRLRSLWLEKVVVPRIPDDCGPFNDMRKISLVLSKINNSLDESVIDLPQVFPHLSELTIDHCDDLLELPSSICEMQSLSTLSITNCHSFSQLPAKLGKLKNVKILRLYACPTLKTLPPSVGELKWLKYIDISQCVNLTSLPEAFCKLAILEKIDMRECPEIRSLPRSIASLQSLRFVVCEEESSWLWKDVEGAMPNLHIEVTERCFDLDWLND